MKTISLSQELYIKKILTEFKMMDCKFVATPIILGTRLVPSKQEYLRTHFESSLAMEGFMEALYPGRLRSRQRFPYQLLKPNSEAWWRIPRT
ncbi:hypothetical protein O181_044913 [Austropuccinia psidii MF-1]|uniref:Reverse transcriptase Ty1/copia-type domain-containing protein n=1 Tax=Austropuccinia psidii MF-1 TaxID=1389203 RepID=A0A9Q3DR05_9BASI|nr:hypothetical protein [Austropuccinia psidii MF-1]